MVGDIGDHLVRWRVQFNGQAALQGVPPEYPEIGVPGPDLIKEWLQSSIDLQRMYQ
jgi:hypothetical protein